MALKMKINTNWIRIAEQSPGGLQYEEKEEDSNDAMEEPDERKYSTSPVRHLPSNQSIYLWMYSTQAYCCKSCSCLYYYSILVHIISPGSPQLIWSSSQLRRCWRVHWLWTEPSNTGTSIQSILWCRQGVIYSYNYIHSTTNPPYATITTSTSS